MQGNVGQPMEGHQVQSSQASNSFYISVLGTADVLTFAFTHLFNKSSISSSLPKLSSVFSNVKLKVSSR